MGGGGISGLSLTKDGRTLFFEEAGRLQHQRSLGAPPTGGGGTGGGGGRDAGPRRWRVAVVGRGRHDGRGDPGSPTRRPVAAVRSKKVNFNVTLESTSPQEWGEMFDDAWRTMKYRFYDAKMHGKDWDAMRAKYKPLVAYVADTHELMNIINEMIGELNASHTGARPAGAGPLAGRGAVGSPTRHLGVDLTPTPLRAIATRSPTSTRMARRQGLDQARNGQLPPRHRRQAGQGGRRHRRLPRPAAQPQGRADPQRPSPRTPGSWKIKYEPIASAAFANLRYERWVNERRAKVDELSQGRVGYLHIKAMDQPSLARFKKDLAEFRHKEALVIDQRWNGGGNIEQELLAILVQKPYQVWQPRGTEPTGPPVRRLLRPKVVLQNWRSASNAEMFPAGFRALGLGKVIGTPTMGAVIGTGRYSLIDGSTIRTPGVGVYLSDETHTNLENLGVKPDVFVENSPEDNLAGRDRQLDVAVSEVMKGLKPNSDVAGRD